MFYEKLRDILSKYDIVRERKREKEREYFRETVFHFHSNILIFTNDSQITLRKTRQSVRKSTRATTIRLAPSLHPSKPLTLLQRSAKYGGERERERERRKRMLTSVGRAKKSEIPPRNSFFTARNASHDNPPSTVGESKSSSSTTRATMRREENRGRG